MSMKIRAIMNENDYFLNETFARLEIVNLILQIR
jgi:hypothetical protein